MSEEKSGVTAIIQTYYCERTRYLRDIIQSLREQTIRPERIILWDNQGRCPDDEECDVVASSFNTLLGRYAAVLLAETPHVLIQDDDLILGPDSIAMMLDRVNKGATGIAGCRLDWPPSPTCYQDAQWVTEGYCDVLLGRAFIAHRSWFLPGFKYLLDGGRPPGRSDDIMFSLLSAHRPYVMPGVVYSNLDEGGVGLSHEPQHMKERNEAAGFYLNYVNQ